MTQPEPRLPSPLLSAVLTACLSAPAWAQVEADVKPVADASVSEREPDRKDGASPALRVGFDGQRELAYLRFDLSSIPKDARVLSGSLRFRAAVTGDAPVLDYAAAQALWQESGMTFATRPKGVKLLQSAPVANGDNELPLSPELLSVVQDWVARPGQNFGLEISTASGSAKKPSLCKITSREGASASVRPPLLELRVARVKLATTSLPGGFTGVPYEARIDTSLFGVQEVEFQVLDSLPSGLRSEPSGTSLRILGRPTVTFDSEVRVRVRNVATGLQDTRIYALDIARADNTIRIQDGAPGREDLVFPASNAATPLVTLVPKITNNNQIAVELRSIRLALFGPEPLAPLLESVSLFEDRDNDGKVGSADLRLAGPLPIISDVLPVALELSDYQIPALQTRQFLFVVQPRADCPAGAEFQAAFNRRSRISGVFVGTNGLGSRPSFFSGPRFVCEARRAFPADANGDGRLDCLDLQVLARGLGSAASAGADPNRSGVIENADVEMALDAILGRPVVTGVEIVEVLSPLGGTLRFARFRGLGFGADPVLRIDGRRVDSFDLMFAGDRICVARLDGLQSGLQPVSVVNGLRASRVRAFELR